MANFLVGKDLDRSESAGAGGMFQIERLIDEHGNDVTFKVDVGIHFLDDNQLKEYLSEIFGVPRDNIDLTEM